jgi:tRNA threonylcarbamoyladenosine biosynthesis protein TsaB
MTLLAINTVGPACEVALATAGGVDLSRSLPMTRGHDSALAPLVQEVLAEAGVSAGALSGIAVVTGPGSFTGLRVGIAFAIGLGLPHRVPVVGVTAFEAAWMTNVVGHSPGASDQVRIALPAQVRPPDLTWWVQDLERGLAIGSAREVGADTLNAGPPVQVGGASALGALAFAQWLQAQAAFDPALRPPRPLYIRPPDAALPARPSPWASLGPASDTGP